ncbi:uncharacterized protein P174DRAFT_54251 [Aspergillus novofumigatus IBT 16806]|uniref:Uncharacterized protein n=1 Tax=Aspergillus novofumigatus (strain IBT 16806) TaxID=1392255 RepID=A0A2I1BUW8_ASPN1|nr:uncharacterized protein P174DRAFT_54251 [Aspergillus novofumigatus IBT 16806]PKX89162.1 hypothetical protein P174DRAFT_54251 [Aspergillus novofumigatus IBT 16806]
MDRGSVQREGGDIPYAYFSLALFSITLFIFEDDLLQITLPSLPRASVPCTVFVTLCCGFLVCFSSRWIQGLLILITLHCHPCIITTKVASALILSIGPTFPALSVKSRCNVVEEIHLPRQSSQPGIIPRETST